MNRKALALIALPSALGLAVAGSALPASAATRPHGNVNVNVACSKGSIGNLQVQREDNGRLSLDFGVDMARHTAGIVWSVHVTDNGKTVVNSNLSTASDGSFSVTRSLPAASSSRIVAVATNRSTGEVCRITRTA